MVLPRFLAELKHRNVYRAAVVYAAVGWALLEAADVVLPRLGLPDWTVNLVLALVLLGFPLAIVFAWIFDISAQGIVRTEPISPRARHRFSFVSIAEFVLICVLVVTVGYLYVDRLSLQKGLIEPEIARQDTPEVPNPEQYRAIAVLPFADMSESGDQAWFAEGIAEELLIALSQVDDLNVVARTSSFAFKNTDKTIADIAGILGVQAVLEGSVRRIGDQVRVTAQLIDADTGYRIWSGSYQRELTNIFKLQDELALSVVQTLRLKLGLGPQEDLVAEQTRSAEAYSWFIRGRALFDWSNAQTHLRSIDYFNRAVTADPGYALAWGYLAYAQASSVLWRPVGEVYEPARAAYERALSLDPGQSEAVAARALISMVRSFDWETAGRDLQPAISAGSTVALWAYSAMLLPALDRLEESIHLQRLSEERDPLHAGIKAGLAIYLLWSGKVEEAIIKARQALAIDRGHLYALMALIEGYTLAGQYEQAEKAIESVPEGLRQHPSITARVGLYFVAKGDEDRAREILQNYLQSPPLVNILIVSELALKLGEIDQTFYLMKRAADEHAWPAFWIRIRYRDNALINNHPRYLSLLEQIGLDDKSVKELQDKLSL
jgi:TolB-like protein/Flp pilus assembly protein TadD